MTSHHAFLLLLLLLLLVVVVSGFLPVEWHAEELQVGKTLGCPENTDLAAIAGRRRPCHGRVAV